MASENYHRSAGKVEVDDISYILSWIRSDRAREFPTVFLDPVPIYLGFSLSWRKSEEVTKQWITRGTWGVWLGPRSQPNDGNNKDQGCRE
jgi:hypothetical protein